MLTPEQISKTLSVRLSQGRYESMIRMSSSGRLPEDRVQELASEASATGLSPEKAVYEVLKSHRLLKVGNESAHKADETNSLTAIIAQIEAGHTQRAFEQVQERYGPLVMAKCLTVAGPEEIGAEVHETFERVHKVLAEIEPLLLQGERAVESWISRVAQNVASQSLRRRREKIEDVSLEDLATQLTSKDLIMETDSQIMVDVFFFELSPIDRQIILLRWSGGATDNEIAEVLGISPRRVSYRRQRVGVRFLNYYKNQSKGVRGSH